MIQLGGLTLLDRKNCNEVVLSVNTDSYSTAKIYGEYILESTYGENYGELVFPWKKGILLTCSS